LTSTFASAYSSALRAAFEAAGHQNYPPGALYVVATPIGNLADITLRALHVLGLADTIACEDTRHTQALLRAYGIDKSSAQLLAVHQHNEAEAAQSVIDRLRQGQRVAYASDAGTPAISDPGARLVAAVRLASLPVVPLPGASSVTAALSVAGIADDGEARAVVLLEAPHRIEALASALAALGTRALTIGRELTKQFEEITTLSAAGFPAWLSQDANRLRGEFVLVLHPAPTETHGGPDTRVLKLLLEQLPLKTAVKLAADITGEPRNALYELALGLKEV
jgi:16S rRNA (cytidine1402-2'-O)-methyltransferase